MERWSTQVRGVAEVLALHAAGHRAVCLTAPTGGGKSVMMQDLALEWLDRHERVILFTNRRLLVKQLIDRLTEAGIDHGVRAAGHDADPDALFQISSIQTEVSRHLDAGTLFPADLVLVDEAHLMTGKTAERIVAWYLARGATVVGVTATPIGVGEFYRKLVVAGTNSELRQIGALVPAIHYAPDEPDMKALKKKADPEDADDDIPATSMGPRASLIGRVWRWYETLNPARKPCILFAPGVAEAHWFAQQFAANGIPAASLAADKCWAGDWTEDRDDIGARFKAGEIKVLCNRFVLREGIDLPAVEHLIFATVFGSLQTYLQAGGRGLRAAPGKTRCVVQDHGGNWWRHGSLNADRQWHLGYDAGRYAADRKDALRDAAIPEPARCRKCGVVCGKIVQGFKCPECGYEWFRVERVRPVVTTDGTLREVKGTVYRPRVVRTYRDTAKLWAQVYWRCRNSKKRSLTFRQALGLFEHENHYEPERDLKWMPKNPEHWFWLVKDVAFEHLIGVDARAEA